MRKRILTFILCLSFILGNLIGFPFTVNAVGAAPNQTVTYLEGSDLLYDLMESATTFVVAQQKALGASHYAYTEALYEESTGEAASGVGTEMQFHPGSRLVMITLEAEGDPSVFNMNLRVMRPADGKMMKLVKYDLTGDAGESAEDVTIDLVHNHVLTPANEG